MKSDLTECGIAHGSLTQNSVATARPPLPGQVAWTLVGNLSYAGAQWGILIVLAKTVSPAMVGQFGLGLAIVTPVLMMTNLQLRAIQATHASDTFTFADFLGFRLACTSVALLAISLIAASSGYGPATARVVIAVGAAKCVESISDTAYGQLQRAEMMSRIALSMAGKGALSLVAVSLAVLYTRDVLVGTIALGLAWTVVLGVYDLRNADAAESKMEGAAPTTLHNVKQSAAIPRLQWSAVARIARLGLPLGITSLLLALATNTPRYFLERFHGEEVLGYFTALAYPTAAFSILLNAFGQAATPRMAAFYRSDRREFRRTVFILAVVPVASLLIAAPVLFLFGPRILTWLYRPDYAGYFSTFVLLIVAGTLWSLASVLGYAATASGRLNGQVPISGFICLVAVVVGAALVPSHGMQGAAMVAIAAALAAIATYAGLLCLPDRVSG